MRIGDIPIHQEPLARIRLADQPTLHDFFELPGGDESLTSEHIEATGDPLTPKAVGLIRIALQNPNGIRLKDNVDVLPEVTAIEQLHIDAAAFPESKLSSRGRTRDVMNRQLNSRLGSSRVVAVAAQNPERSTSEYQPGGVLTAVVGRLTGRVEKTYSDPWGRFTLVRLRGARNKGIVLLTVYRVCQRSGSNAGPTTAYSQQIGEMLQLQEELRNVQQFADRGESIPQSTRRRLDPRTRLLQDLLELINNEQREGFRPIICMDANEDWSSRTGTQSAEFIRDAGLSDPLCDRFYQDGVTPTTYARGSQRIDYILFDEALVPAI